jgi:thioredoxin-like negative regulator of GroEL
MQTISLVEIQSILASKPAVLLYFYSDNCAPCISLRPKVEELLKADFPEMELLLVNSEKHPDITAQFGVFANPTLLLYFDGHEHQRLSKYVGVAQLKEAISRPYSLLLGA